MKTKIHQLPPKEKLYETQLERIKRALKDCEKEEAVEVSSFSQLTQIQRVLKSMAIPYAQYKKKQGGGWLVFPYAIGVVSRRRVGKDISEQQP